MVCLMLSSVCDIEMASNSVDKMLQSECILLKALISRCGYGCMQDMHEATKHQWHKTEQQDGASSLLLSLPVTKRLVSAD